MFLMFMCLFLSDGNLDSTFANGGGIEYVALPPSAEADGGVPSSVLIQPDGKIVVGVTWLVNRSEFGLIRLNEDGSRDTGFGTNGLVRTLMATNSNGALEKVLLRGNGKILALGQVELGGPGGPLRMAMSSYLPNGALDTGFGANGIALQNLGTPDTVAVDMANFPGNKILCLGAVGTSIVLVQIDAETGALITSYGASGINSIPFSNIAGEWDEPIALQVDPTGSSYVVARHHTATGTFLAVAKVAANGALDTSFGTAGKIFWKGNYQNFYAEKISKYPVDDANLSRFLIIGTGQSGISERVVVLSFDQDGELDGAFGANGFALIEFGDGYSEARCFVVESDRVSVAGKNVPALGDDELACARIGLSGQLDTTFGTLGVSSMNVNYAGNEEWDDMTMQADGRLVLVGVGAPTQSVVIARLCASPNLSIDWDRTLHCPGDVVQFQARDDYPDLDYHWSVPSGSSIMSGQGSRTIQVLLGPAGGNITVQGENPCGLGPLSSESISLYLPPQITQNPSDLAICPGQTAQFQIGLSNGTPTWRFNGVAIAGAGHTNTLTLTWSAIQSLGGVSGSIDCEVSSPCETVLSTPALLTIRTPPQITKQPQALSICEGESASLNVVATGTGLSYQWQRGNVNIPGATGFSLTLNAATPAENGNYRCVVTGTCGQITSSTVAVLVNPAPQQPSIIAGNTGVCPTALETYSILPDEASTWTWSVPSGSSIMSGQGTSTIQVVWGTSGGDVSVVGNYICGMSSPRTIPVNVWASTEISLHPQSTSICEGTDHIFSVTATGSAITYQWRKNGVALSGGTGNSYFIEYASVSDAGTYDCVVTGLCGAETTQSANLTVKTQVVIQQDLPQTETGCLEGSIQFHVAATGSGLSYQWQKDGVDIPGAHGQNLFLSDLDWSDAGDYTCIVSGQCNTAFSQVCALTILEPIFFTDQPQSMQPCIGEPVSLAVNVIGSSPSYQWYLNGSPIPGETFSTLDLGTAGFEDEGSYFCVVSNFCGSLTSASAVISLNTELGLWVSPGQSQGFCLIELNAGPLCGIPDYTVQWQNLTSGQIYGVGENPIIIDPPLNETSFFQVTIVDNQLRATVSHIVPVLVSDIMDWNGDGWNTIEDFQAALPYWRSFLTPDPNGDGFMDIRDYLFINTQCQPE